MKHPLRKLVYVLIALLLIYFAAERFRFKSDSRPDVFIYLIDTLRADHLSCYGYDRPTSPVIDAFADSAILFEQAQTTVTWTRPAVASLFTGLYGSAHGVLSHNQYLADDLETLPEILQQAGYKTFAVSTNYHVQSKFGFGQGFDAFAFDSPGTWHWAYQYARCFLENTPPDDPIFMYVHTIEPHYSYKPSAKNRTRFDRGYKGSYGSSGEDLTFLKRDVSNISAEDILFLVDLYDGEIADADMAFGSFLSLLQEMGRYEDAIIILVADHGEAFAEHGSTQHGIVLNAEELHIPLIIRLPHNASGGLRVKEPVSLIDILPTVLPLTNTIPAEDCILPGVDLTQPIAPRNIHCEIAQIVSANPYLLGTITADLHKRTLDLSLSDEATPPVASVGLWDLQHDPRETMRLQRACPEIDRELYEWHGMMEKYRLARTTPTITLTAHDKRNLRALGYLR